MPIDQHKPVVALPLEQQARHAAQAGDKKRAMQLFDRAVAEDPRRAFGVFNACLQTGIKDTQAYKDLWQAQADNGDADKFSKALDAIYKRQRVVPPPPNKRPTLIGLMHRSNASPGTPPRAEAPRAPSPKTK